MLSTALVDVGGTLWPERTGPAVAVLVAARRRRLGAAGVPASGLDRLLRALTEATADADELDYFDVRAATAQACAIADVAIDVEVVRQAMCLPAAGLGPLLPDARGLLGQIRSIGLRCVILSNAIWRSTADYWDDFRTQGIAALVDVVVCSTDTCWRKPHRRIFEIALEAARAPASACVMIGNSEDKDVLPAARLSMRTIRMAIEEPVPLKSHADVICPTLTDATEALAELAAKR